MLMIVIPDAEISMVFCWFVNSPDGTNNHSSRSGQFEGMGYLQGTDSCKIIFLWVHFVFTCADAAGCIISPQCTVTQKGIQQHHQNSRSYCVSNAIG